jgi:RNA polymerase sigma factor (sigma-70 family)
LEEKDLISQYKRSDDQKYLAELFKQYEHLIYGVCLKYLKDPDEARDTTQEIYLQVARKLKTHSVDAFRPWVYVLTKNHCFDILRRKKRFVEKEFQANIMYSGEVFHPDEVVDQEMLNKLSECIESLPKDQNRCIQLFYFDKLSYKEICQQTEFDLNKVRSQIQNGRRNLKLCMEG